MSNIEMPLVTDGSPDEVTESVEQLRERLNTMKRLMELDGERKRARRHNPPSSTTVIDGSFLSVVFMVVLVMIVCVSGYAFLNLYRAVLKKFPAKPHTEL
ncbi:uncharacterized protein LOC134537177 [Bacillus rossius redtenbacheri]|uniref:uncharacterized protein LOC134537177 n=1 Tax=Bacillus rossius redtenbacheri TaxID=93214 RepID=UPI002FDDF637